MAPNHLGLDIVSNHEDFTTLFDYLKVVVIKVLVVSKSEISPSDSVVVFDQQWVELLVDVPTAKALDSGHQEVPPVVLDSNWLDLGELQDSRVLAVVP